MRVAKVAVLGSLVLTNLAAASAVAVTSASPPATSQAGLSADASAMRGHGELAVIHAHQLYLVGGPTNGATRVALAHDVTRPQWSHDGKWLAVSVSPAPPKNDPYKSEPTIFWLVSARGKVERRLAACGSGSTGSWSPRSDRFVVSCDGNRHDVVEVIGLGGAKTHIATADTVSGVAWSPSGRRIAVARNHYATSGWDDRLVVFPAEGGAGRLVTKEAGSVLDVAGWWPDGSGILVWLDYQGSGSLAADGLPLIDVSVSNGHRRRLTKAMLTYPQWLSTSKAREEVAFIAGGDRELTLGHKHLEICGQKSCHEVKQKATQVSFDPALSEHGELAVIRDKAVSPRHGFGMSYIDKTQASGGLALVFPYPRERAVRLASGASASDPVWGRPGEGSMLVVKKRSLWLLTNALNTATWVAGPLDVSVNRYYGFVPWGDSFAWSGAAR